MVRLYEGVPRPDLSAVCRCLMFLGDAEEVAAILARLLGCARGGWAAQALAGGRRACSWGAVGARVSGALLACLPDA